MTPSRLNAMSLLDRETENRIFVLLGEPMTAREISDAVGLDPDDGPKIVYDVFKRRGNPNLVAIDRALERLAAIRASSIWPSGVAR